MKHFISVVSIFRNKYLLAGSAFVVWILFFDKNDLFTQMERRGELNQMKESKAFFQQQIEEERKFSDELKHNPSIIEKYAREKYFMKKDNEDLFIIQPVENN